MNTQPTKLDFKIVFLALLFAAIFAMCASTFSNQSPATCQQEAHGDYTRYNECMNTPTHP